MEALVLTEYNKDPAKALHYTADFPTPVVTKATEMLVRVHAAGLNPAEGKLRQGNLRLIARPRLPFILGADFAGTVAATGSAAARRFGVGDKVYGRITFSPQRHGTYAE